MLTVAVLVVFFALLTLADVLPGQSGAPGLVAPGLVGRGLVGTGR